VKRLHKQLGRLLLVLALVASATSCGEGERAKDVVLVTHDSFVVSPQVRRGFERETGLRWRILQTGDAGEALTRALLTAGNPQGDVFFGVDNNLLSRALDGDLFDSYESPAVENVAPEYDLDPEHRVIPVDHGDVCLNYDKSWFAEHGIPPPSRLGDLVLPRYKGLLVVENPATSTPGLAFMLATIARYGESGWLDYWRKLSGNAVLVVDGWERAYNVEFSGSSGNGSRPVVVSYASSPPAEVIFRKPRPKRAPTAVVGDGCFRQIEFAGVLRGAPNEDGARKLVDFMLSKRFQEDIPLSMFVFPVIEDAILPREFALYARPAGPPRRPLFIAPSRIAANRARWIEQWTNVVIR
jgi:thiamine transport system substrate-binding protein